MGTTSPSLVTVSRDAGRDRRHDFWNKLRQPKLVDATVAYITGQQTTRKSGKISDVTVRSPIMVQLDPTTVCNYACPHCGDAGILNKGRLDHSVLMDSLRLLIDRGLLAVILIGGGEPTLYPYFGELIRFLKNAERPDGKTGVQIGLVSNGSGCHRIHEVADCFDERDWVRLSLDSGDDQTFWDMHLPKGKSMPLPNGTKGPFTLTNILSWAPKIKEKNPRIQLGFSFVVVGGGISQLTAHGDGRINVISNVNEIVLAAKRARAASFDYFSVKAYFDRSDEDTEVVDPSGIENFPLFKKIVESKIEEAKQKLGDAFIVVSHNLRSLLDGTWIEATNQGKRCHMPAFRTIMTPSGIYHCPAYRGVDRARIAPFDGYAAPERFAETLHATAVMIEHFDASRECDKTVCPYNSANRALEDVITGADDLSSLSIVLEKHDYFF